jgi:hypothetical protein
MPPIAERRLPGIRFEAAPPPLDEILPRMDIALFAGFAASGPVHVPVVIEDAAEFAAIFGADAPLARDPVRGGVVRAHLGPAVRAFFRNGGTRCWVVRVAGAASSNFFPVPGLARAAAGRITPAFARAASPGSWSDGQRVGAAAIVRPLDFDPPRPRGALLDVDLRVEPRTDLALGDLLQLRAGDRFGVLPVTELASAAASPPGSLPPVTATGRPIWFRTTPAPPDAPGPLEARVYTARREPGGLDEDFARVPVPVLNDPARWTTGVAPGMVQVELRLDVEQTPEPGELVSIDLGSEELWIGVREIGVVEDRPEAGGDVIRVSGRGLWWLRSAAPAPPAEVTVCERVLLELWVRDTGRTTRLGDLGLTPAHARYWADLPDDAARYDTEREGVPAMREIAGERGFPLAGAGSPDAVYLPIDLAPAPDLFLGPARPNRSALERDGLDLFAASLFVDPELSESSAELLSDATERLRYRVPPRRPLGVHAALGIEEATIVAVPDAVHRGWTTATPAAPPPPAPSAPLVPPLSGDFLDCAIRSIPPPTSLRRITPGTGGTFTLAWQGGPGLSYELEESRSADLDGAAAIYAGADPRVTLYGREEGIYYYRVRALAAGQTSDWSEGIGLRVIGASAFTLSPADTYRDDALVAVHRSLLRIAAARGDMLAVLAAPDHYREDEAIAHVASLRRSTPEERAFSFGALYHPWTMTGEPDETGEIGAHPPDGACCGLLAERALRRGAWIAPANEPLRGVVALTPPIARARRRDLQAAQVNVIRQEPRGFLALSADTLSVDSDLLPLNVRRLLSLLRRLALREGAAYVFEPHDASFRRLVQRGFESFLTRLFERGAFAGRTARSSFQVVTSTSVNTPASVDLGRFIVELRVAPALPMTFLTVRLVQSGDRTLVVEGR